MHERPAIHMQHVRYLSNGRTILDDLCFSARPGKITAVLGPSGSGKSTLLKAILGKAAAQKGTIEVLGTALHDLSVDGRLSLRAQFGMLFQAGALFSQLTLFDNVALPLRVHTQLPEQLIGSIVRLKLSAVGLTGAESLYPSQLSGGMTKRGALARALALDPPILLLDEPFVGQDPATVKRLSELLIQLSRKLQVTIVIVSHDIPEVLPLSDEVYLLEKGTMVWHGAKEKIFTTSKLQAFLAGTPEQTEFPADDWEILFRHV